MDSVPGFHMNTEDINTGGTGLCVSVLTRSSVPCVSVFPINSTEGNVPSRYCDSFRAIHLHKMRGSCALRSCLHTPHPSRRLRPRRASAGPAAAGHTSSVSPLAGDASSHLPHEGKAEAERDFAAEWRELAEAHPEVVGKELPEDIYRACMESELPPLRVYETMMLSKQAEEIESLKKEIATLRQNAETAARAPVSAVSDYGGSTEPEDLFARSFKSY